jgi:hypothetical protein
MTGGPEEVAKGRVTQPLSIKKEFLHPDAGECLQVSGQHSGWTDSRDTHPPVAQNKNLR